ncbi:hypothetical protein GOBAR_DD01378 [Gossypium barbadense]|nr:hypothetical protein GOBAR_DD01378 [Gossypium barbadense]
MSVSEEQNTKLFKARRTVVQMLRDRGYSVPDSDIKMTRQQFIEKYGENVHLKRDDLLILCSKGDAPTDQLIVEILYFTLDLPLELGFPILCFKYKEAELLTNITEHMFVPKHTVLTNQEKKELLEKYRVKETQLLVVILLLIAVCIEHQLPRILVSDPVAKYYGMKRGQVVKITRQSVTADTYDTYRYAV